MPFVDSHGLRIATEAFGDPSDPAVLLVMGATASMLGWPDGFVTALARQGFHVIRFDHRDTGHSTTVAPGAATYSVEDMAGDLTAILDAYGLDRAHVAGMSLGGYLSQILAVTAPERVASLALIASEPLGWDGEPLPSIAPAFLEHFGGLAGLDWTDRDAVTDFLTRSERLCAAGDFDEPQARAVVTRVLSRTSRPASMFNHASLTLRDDWTGRFREIRCPVLVIHGEEDPILPVENGLALAGGIPGAQSLILPGVGHELPPRAVPQIIARLAQHFRA